MNVGNKVIHGFEIPKMLTSINLTIQNYCDLQKGNQNTFGFAVKNLKKKKFNFILPVF